jgi:hypothetical protein
MRHEPMEKLAAILAVYRNANRNAKAFSLFSLFI